MRIDYNKPEAKIYDLTVDGKPQGNWVSADEGTGEYEIFVEDVPWRGGGRIVDTDNPTGYQTLKQKGKVEFKRNDLPDPSTAGADPAPWENCWGNYCGAAHSLVPYSIAFSVVEGENWTVVENGETWDCQLRFTSVDSVGDVLRFEALVTNTCDGLTAVPGPQPVIVAGTIPRPGLNWSHEWKDGVCHRSFTLTAHSKEHEGWGLTLLQRLDSLCIWMSQEVGLPV